MVLSSYNNVIDGKLIKGLYNLLLSKPSWVVVPEPIANLNVLNIQKMFQKQFKQWASKFCRKSHGFLLYRDMLSKISWMPLPNIFLRLERYYPKNVSYAIRAQQELISLDIMQQTACLVVNPIIVDGYASLFNCTTAVRASDSMTVSS